MPQSGFDPNPGRAQSVGIFAIGLAFVAIARYFELRGAFSMLLAIGTLFGVLGFAGLFDPRLVLGFTPDGKAHFPPAVHYTSLALVITGFALGVVLIVFVFKAVP